MGIKGSNFSLERECAWPTGAKNYLLNGAQRSEKSLLPHCTTPVAISLGFCLEGKFNIFKRFLSHSYEKNHLPCCFYFSINSRRAKPRFCVVCNSLYQAGSNHPHARRDPALYF